MTSPVCPDLWTSVTVDHLGNVYACCLNRPCRFGSIYGSDLRDLINSDEAVAARREALLGRLGCMEGCTWIRERVDRDTPTIDYGDLRHLQIAFGELCNISCIMCRQRARHDGRTLDEKALIANIDLEPFESIFITGGEPLAIPSCIRYMEHLISIGRRFGISTNGTMMDRPFVDRFIGCLDTVTVSVNAATRGTHEAVNRGSDFDRVIGNVRYARESRDRNGTDTVLIGRMTLTVPALKEIPEFIEVFEGMGFDRINFGFDRDTVPGFLVSNPGFASDLRRRVASAMDRADVGRIDAHRLRVLGLLRDDDE